MKRFEYDNYGRLNRIGKKIRFNPTIDMAVHIEGGRKRRRANHLYRLTSIICHKGSSCLSGHYIAYVRRGSRWFLCNDSLVREVNEDKVLQQTSAYMLFYEREERGETADVEEKEEKVEEEAEAEVEGEEGVTQEKPLAISKKNDLEHRLSPNVQRDRRRARRQREKKVKRGRGMTPNKKGLQNLETPLPPRTGATFTSTISRLSSRIAQRSGSFKMINIGVQLFSRITGKRGRGRELKISPRENEVKVDVKGRSGKSKPKRKKARK